MWKISCLLLALVVCQAHAWGHIGHSAIADAAWYRLTDTAKDAVVAYLGSKTMASQANQPDTYASSDDGGWSSPLHFINNPLNTTNFAMNISCVDWPGCVTSAICDFARVLNESTHLPTSTYSDWPPIPLVYVIHFVGDTHQPLHVAFGEDYGGNSFPVSLEGSGMSLHDVWDFGIINNWEYSYANVSDSITQWIEDHQDEADAFQSVMHPVKWANESFALARKHCYNVYPLLFEAEKSGVTPEVDDGAVDWDRLGRFLDSMRSRRRSEYGPYLGSDYVYRSLKVIKSQLSAAAIRLAETLNQVLDKDYQEKLAKTNPSQLLTCPTDDFNLDR